MSYLCVEKKLSYYAKEGFEDEKVMKSHGNVSLVNTACKSAQLGLFTKSLQTRKSPSDVCVSVFVVVKVIKYTQ